MMTFGTVGTLSGAAGMGGGPFAGATALFDFLNGTAAVPSGLVPVASALTVTRAGDGYADAAAGGWSPFGANAPRRTNRGLLVEEGRTNGLRNNSMQGAATGTPGTRPTNWFIAPSGNIGTLVANIVGLGVEDGIDYIDVQLVGTPTGTGFLNALFGVPQEAAALTGQTWTHSVFITRIAGSTANLSSPALGVSEHTSANAFVTNGSSVITVATGALGQSRRAYTRTLSGGATVAGIQPFFAYTYAAGAVDITLRIGWPQLEQGAFATSPIRTTGTAATRAVDVVSALNPALILNPSLFSWAAEFQDTVGVTSTDRRVFASRIDGSNTVYCSVTPANVVRQEVVNAGAVQAGQNSTDAVAAGGIYKVAGRVQADNFGLRVSGLGAPPADDTAGTPPTGSHAIWIGQGNSGVAPLNGYIRRLAFFSAPLTNAQLEALVA
jgi:hypothetical protein